MHLTSVNRGLKWGSHRSKHPFQSWIYFQRAENSWTLIIPSLSENKARIHHIINTVILILVNIHFIYYLITYWTKILYYHITSQLFPVIVNLLFISWRTEEQTSPEEQTTQCLALDFNFIIRRLNTRSVRWKVPGGATIARAVPSLLPIFAVIRKTKDSQIWLQEVYLVRKCWVTENSLEMSFSSHNWS